jgi:predicted O-methyltransferase YrrM
MPRTRQILKRLISTVPGLRRVHDRYREFYRNRQTLAEWSRFVPPGHFYSPIPDLGEVKQRETAIFARDVEVPAINLNVAAQLELLRSFARFHDDLPWRGSRLPGLRYYYENDWFACGDAIILCSFMRQFQPKRIIEIGSGFSSCLMLDANERFLGGATRLTFVEPFEYDRIHGLLTDSERVQVDVRKCRLQDLALEEVSALRANDILFVDSSHVAKVGSDVNWLFSRIIPLLPPGVLLHLHDIFYPFEYPQEWVLDGRAWNEAYLLRAFLMYNSAFRIEYWCDFVATFHRDELATHLPLCLSNTGGSIWLRRTQDPLTASATKS